MPLEVQEVGLCNLECGVCTDSIGQEFNKSRYCKWIGNIGELQGWLTVWQSELSVLDVDINVFYSINGI